MAEIHWIHDEFPQSKDIYRQQGFAAFTAFTVSLSGIDAVAANIENQAEHHHVKSFQEELREFLKRHGIEFDERNMWD